MNEIEETMKRLNEIIYAFENNNLSMDQSIELFEESIALTKKYTENIDIR